MVTFMKMVITRVKSRSPDMIPTAFEGKFDENKYGMPHGDCRPLNKLKKNNVEKEDHQKVETKQCRKSESQKVGNKQCRTSGFINLYIPSYTFTYLQIAPNSFIYLHIPPYTLIYLRIPLYTFM